MTHNNAADKDSFFISTYKHLLPLWIHEVSSQWIVKTSSGFVLVSHNTRTLSSGKKDYKKSFLRLRKSKQFQVHVWNHQFNGWQEVIHYCQRIYLRNFWEKLIHLNVDAERLSFAKKYILKINWKSPSRFTINNFSTFKSACCSRACYCAMDWWSFQMLLSRHYLLTFHHFPAAFQRHRFS